MVEIRITQLYDLNKILKDTLFVDSYLNPMIPNSSHTYLINTHLNDDSTFDITHPATTIIQKGPDFRIKYRTIEYMMKELTAQKNSLNENLNKLKELNNVKK